VVALALLGARAARAELLVEAVPTLSGGYTDNAGNSASGRRRGDEFGSVSGSGRLHYVGLRTDQSLGYHVGIVEYVSSPALNSLTQDVTYASSYTLGESLVATLGAAGVQSHTATYSPTPVAVVMPQPLTLGDRVYRSGTATQALVLTPTAKQRYTQTFTAQRLEYVSQDPAILQMPNFTSFGGTLRGAFDAGRDVYSLELQGTDTKTGRAGPSMGPVLYPFDAIVGHRLYSTLLAGWRRELTPLWTLSLSLGAVVLADLSFDNRLLSPAGTVELGYHKYTWFATFLVQQTAAANLFIGNATLNDIAIARLSLPIDRRERFVASGFAGYTYARNPERATRSYDLLTTGATLTGHLPKTPLWASIDYSFLTQRGSAGGLVALPNRIRQVVVLSVGGTFSVGTESPPLSQGIFY
jgi:hypothetical protein